MSKIKKLRLRNILLILVISFSIFTFFGCQEEEPDIINLPEEDPIKNTIKPLIMYEGSVGKNPTYEIGDEIDFLEGIYALDDIDGDITNEVVVESSKFDADTPGAYYVFYSVVDSSGNTNEYFYRIFTLIEKVDERIMSSGKINSLNGQRNADYIVYYSYKVKGNSTGTNQWGYEISVNSDGYVVECDTHVTILEGGFALSGNGAGKTALIDIQIGDIITVDTSAKTYSVIRDEVKSNIFRVNLAIEASEVIRAESYASGVDFDIDLADSYIKKAKDLYQDVLDEKSSILDVVEEIDDLCTKVNYMTSLTKDVDIRAVWHRPGATTYEGNLSGLQSLLQTFKRLGINNIFLETFWNGYASYRSDILETHPLISTYYYGEEYGNDYILAFTTEASKLGISVHAWCHVFNAGSNTYKSNVVKDSMLVEDYQGRLLHPNTYGGAYYYDPSNPEVIELLTSVFEEMITKYSFTGIQYDYIRYYDNNYSSSPIQDSGYGANAEAIFKSTYKLTGDVREMITNLETRSLWNEWRINNITNAVKVFSQAIKKINKEIIISAAVVRDIESAKKTYMQDWLTWVNQGYIDMLCPMIYTGDSAAIESLSQDIVNQITNKAFLASGIAPMYYDYGVKCQFDEINATLNVNGVCLFASQNVISLEEVETSLEIGNFRNEVISPFATYQEISKYCLEGLIDKINNVYFERSLITENEKNALILKLEAIDYNEAIASVIINLEKLRLETENEDVQEKIDFYLNSLINTLKIKQQREILINSYIGD